MKRAGWELFVLGLMVGICQPVYGAEATPGSLQFEVQECVKKIVGAIGNEKAVELDTPFKCKSVSADNGQIGPLVQDAFESNFRAQNIELRKDSNVLVTVSFFTTPRDKLAENLLPTLFIAPTAERRDGAKVVKLIELKVHDPAGKGNLTPEEEKNQAGKVTSTRELAVAFGVPGAKLPDEKELQGKSNSEQKAERQQALRDQILNPTFHIHGSGNTLLSSRTDSQYDMEILAKPIGSNAAPQAKPIRIVNGQPFVDLGLNDVYEVRLHNRSQGDMAVDLRIDGLNVFHFSQDKNLSYWIVHPSGFRNDENQAYDGTLTVVGWHKSLTGKNNHLSFLVTEFGKGAVTKAGIKARGNVGTIHAAFSHFVPLVPGKSAKGGHETGFGPERTVNQKTLKGAVEVPHEFVTVRYTVPQE